MEINRGRRKEGVGRGREKISIVSLDLGSEAEKLSKEATLSLSSSKEEKEPQSFFTAFSGKKSRCGGNFPASEKRCSAERVNLWLLEAS